MDKEKRKELMDAYKNRTVIGGIYCIKCSGNGRKRIKATTDMQGAKNLYQSSIDVSGCPEPSMMKEWSEYGTASFSFICLEELKKGETQTAAEFAADVKALYELWLEKEKQ